MTLIAIVSGVGGLVWLARWLMVQRCRLLEADAAADQAYEQRARVLAERLEASRAQPVQELRAQHQQALASHVRPRQMAR